LNSITLLDAALVPVILFFTQIMKSKIPKHLRVYLPGVLAFVFIPFVIVINKQGIPSLPVFLSTWVWEGIKTAGAAVYFYMINKKGRKDQTQDGNVVK
jgi:hypothetical protein